MKCYLTSWNRGEGIWRYDSLSCVPSSICILCFTVCVWPRAKAPWEKILTEAPGHVPSLDSDRQELLLGSQLIGSCSLDGVAWCLFAAAVILSFGSDVISADVRTSTWVSSLIGDFAGILTCRTGALEDVPGLCSSTTLGHIITLDAPPSTAAGSGAIASTSRDSRTKPVITLLSRGCNATLLAVFSTITTEMNPVFQPSVTSVSSDVTVLVCLCRWCQLHPLGTVLAFSSAACNVTTRIGVLEVLCSL